MQGGWFERSANFAELCHRLGKSYIVHSKRSAFAAGAILRLTDGFGNYILSTLFYDAVHQRNSCSSRTPLEGSFHQGGGHDVPEKWADAPDVDGA